MVLSAAKMPIEVVRKQIASAIDIMIHLTRMRDGSRKVSEISEVRGYENGEIILNPLYVFQEESEGDSDRERVAGKLQRTCKNLLHSEKFELAGISL